jgi:hypothetical protein
MGLFSSIKKAVSKTWGGIKKTVKTVARTVKKVAKKVAYAVPGGKALWKLGTKVGQGIMKGVGKIVNKLGPVGMMALSFVIGPAVGALWAGFGAGAQALAGMSNVLASTVGSIGQGIFAAGNFVTGTLGAVGEAILGGAGKVIAGEGFSSAANHFATNITNAFTGKAGMAAVHAGAAQAAATASAEVASGDSWFSAAEGAARTSQLSSINQAGMEAVSGLQGLGSVGAEAIAGMDPEMLAKFSPQASMVQQNIQSATMSSPASGLDLKGQFTPDALKPTLSNPMSTYGDGMAQAWKAGATDSGIIRNTASNIAIGNNTFTNISPSKSSALDSIVDNASSLKSLLGGNKEQSGYQPYEVKPIQSTIAKATNASGQGSAGFSLLGGVQGLEESLRRSQSMMFG